MKIGNPFRESWRGLGDWALTTWDNLIDSLQGAWKVEHTDDDRHGHVHATTLQVGRVSYSSIAAPEALANSQVNNFSHASLRDAGMVRFTTALTEVMLTGIQVPQDEVGNILDGRVLVLENASDGVLSLEHEHTASSPANRFVLPWSPSTATGATNRFFLPPKTLTVVVYSSQQARWLVQGRQQDELQSYAEFGSSQNDYAPANFKAARVVRLTATAANLTISGFSSTGLVAPHRKTIINEGTFRFAILHMNTGSAAANRVQSPGGTMYYLHPRESVDLYFETDGTWHILLKADQWVDVAFDAGNYTAQSGTWGVDSADVQTHSYQIDGNMMTVAFDLISTDVSAAATFLRIPIPAGRVAARTMRNVITVTDAGTFGFGLAEVIAGQSTIEFYKAAGAAYTITAADNTAVRGQITFMVQTSCATVSEAHQDTAHGDTAHADGGHSDVAHVDTAGSSSHGDTAHSDSAHGDTAHVDVAFADVAHGDTAHTDAAHDDVAHGDIAHTDNTTHSDVPHGDFDDGAIHTDETHTDNFGSHADVSHTDTEHVDAAHADVAHSDVAHSDTAHSDVAHADGAHSDVAFADTHTDVPHADVTHADSAHTDTAHADTAHIDVGLACSTTHADV